MIKRKVFNVYPNQTGCLFYKNTLKAKLEPGIYRYWDWRDEYALLNISSNLRSLFVSNQEVLTADNIALRFSYVLIYQTIDIDKLLAHFNFTDALRYSNEDILFDKVEKTIRYDVALRSRELISSISSEELNDRRAEFTDFKTEAMGESALTFGIELSTVYLLDLTFPKSIQDLFAKQLEAKIRAKSDLENARTAVATARALKNASELMKDDPNIRFLQFLETLTKVASKGSHTFVIGDRPDI